MRSRLVRIHLALMAIGASAATLAAQLILVGATIFLVALGGFHVVDWWRR